VSLCRYTLAADPIGAVRWFEAMQAVSVLPNEKTFSSIINAFAQAKNIAGAEQWFEVRAVAMSYIQECAHGAIQRSLLCVTSVRSY
jgi:pentatricopeptide repeat protein